MKAGLREAIDREEYRVEPPLVADAIVRHLRELLNVPSVPSTVLVPAHLFQDPPLRPDEREALAVDNRA